MMAPVWIMMAPAIYAGKLWFSSRHSKRIDLELRTLNDRIEAQELIITKQAEMMSAMSSVMERKGLHIVWPWDKVASAS